jgi:N-acetylglucosamine-6-sulfatase
MVEKGDHAVPRSSSQRRGLRRAAALAIGVATGFLCAVWLLAGCERRDDRPNVVFVLVDDHRHDVLSLAGYPSVRTPEIDSLAAAGVRFRSACVTTSLCSPSRASYLTGCYAHRHGVVVNERHDPSEETPLFPALFQAAGYETAFIGKWHQARWASPRRGFDRWVAFNRQGLYTDNTLNVDGRWVLSHDYVTDDLTERALRFLGRKRSRPFFLMLAHKAVHAPFEPAPRHRDLYPGARAPELGADDLDAKADSGGRTDIGPDADAIVRAYLQTLAAVDESVGRLRAQLAKTGQLENTIFVYASDNGYHFGEHGLWDKRTAYEESIRVPLIISWPARWPRGVENDALALNIDLGPTLLEACGVEVPASMQGCSLLPVIAGEAGRDAVLYEYFRGDGPVPDILAVRTRRWKYIRYPRRPDLTDELYDLQTDPHELHNVIDEPHHASRRAELRARLEHLLRETDFRWPAD